ncbi:probable F-box protein At2g36090 [Salvia splendens]|uniref:probable F-box protein At2g36090 n=1 Tax=Salvia splendens TaxID=180675 RepID=UPI001C27792E|nr:probable F-box protein At2g36090 [Salvia splendens]
MNPPPSAGGATAGFPSLHPEIIDSHILSRLDGPALASVACCSAALRRHSSEHSLWLSICHSTWPATASPHLSQLISTFPGGGPRAFFSHAFPLLSKLPLTHPPSSPTEILSAVDIHYDGKLIFTKLHSTDTSSDWFRCSPFRTDLIELKKAAPAAVKSSAGAGDGGMHEGVMTLSWIVIDPVGRRAANLSSHQPVSVRRHWLTGDLEVRFGSVLGGHVMCRIVVTCGGEMEVREVRMEMEDMDGRHLNGEESLVILQLALEAEKATGKNRAVEAWRRYIEFEDMKRERRERELRREGDWDILCLAILVSIYFFFWFYIF